MDSNQLKGTALKLVVAVGLGAVTYVVDPGSAQKGEVYQTATAGECTTINCGDPPMNGGGSGSGSGSSILGFWW
jgi:hypothetical protein